MTKWAYLFTPDRRLLGMLRVPNNTPAIVHGGQVYLQAIFAGDQENDYTYVGIGTFHSNGLECASIEDDKAKWEAANDTKRAQDAQTR